MACRPVKHDLVSSTLLRAHDLPPDPPTAPPPPPQPPAPGEPPVSDPPAPGQKAPVADPPKSLRLSGFHFGSQPRAGLQTLILALCF